MKSIDGRVSKLEQRFLVSSEHDVPCVLILMNGPTCPFPELLDDDPCTQAIHQDPNYRRRVRMFKSIEYGVIPGDVNEKTAQFLLERGWVRQHIGALNHILQSRWSVLFSGSFLPQTYALKNSAMQRDYDHIDRSMEAEEQGKGTEHQRQNIDRLRREAKELARQNLMTSPAIQSDTTKTGKLPAWFNKEP
jgi:hypothetical protein